jgi:histone-lysine N-methyltransferase SETD8
MQLYEEYQEQDIPPNTSLKMKDCSVVLEKVKFSEQPMTKLRDCSVVLNKLKDSQLHPPNPVVQKSLEQKFDELLNIRSDTRQLRDKRVLTKSLQQQFIEVVQEKNHFSIVETLGKGKGVISKINFGVGDWVFEYKGVLMNHKEAIIKEKQYSEDDNTGSFMFFFTSQNKSLCIDATVDMGTVCRMVNHSRRNPNIKPKVFCDPEQQGRPRVIFIACKNIEIGEELQYDYGDHSPESIQAHPWLKF